ncbi:(2Fe-2S)-binding protein [Ferrimonas sediminicola]|nr:(2Fe-2S)-binding protein [Ferrimonas sediminicola]
MSQPAPQSLVCRCLSLTQAEIDEVIQAGAGNADEVANVCGAGSGCGSCRGEVNERCRILASSASDL